VLVAAALLGTIACDAPKRPERARVVAPEQRRMDELMRQNETRASEPALADAYDTINARYFDNRLPPIRIRWEEGLDTIGPLIAEGFRLEGLTNGKVILLNPVLEDDDRQLKAVLCHEMVHVALRDSSETHGAEFQTRLRDLAERGAFEGIVASDEEKRTLKAALDRSSARLANELSDLEQLRTRLEAEIPAMPREAAQDRLWEFNQRIRRHNEDAEEYNRKAAQYNLMTAYPDGLDSERMRTRATVTPGG
jgi:hypothetical protein